jgi:integrase
MSRKVRGRLRTAGEMQLRFDRTFASLKDRYADEIRRRDLREVLDRVADRGASREAQQQRQLMRVLFKWALSQDLIDSDPASALASFGPSPRRDRVLSDDEIKTFWDWMGESDMPPAYVDALRFQLATGARIGEVGGIAVVEIDRENWTWTLPAERSKNGRSRVTPLVGLAKEIIERRLAKFADDRIFLGDGGAVLKSNDVGSMLVKRRKQMAIPHFTSHDLRRTVATGLVDLGFPFELVAAVLGHEAGGKDVRTLLRHYVRTDLVGRKRMALEAWDRRLRQILYGDKIPSNVTALERSAVA